MTCGFDDRFRARARMSAFGAVLAVVLAAAPAAAHGQPGSRPLSISRFVSTADNGFGEEVEPESEEDLGDVLSGDEASAAVLRRIQQQREAAKRQAWRTYQATERYASKKLTNMRFSFTIYNVVYREMKEGSAGWGHYDDLFASGALFTRIHLGEASAYVPTGGFEIAFVGAPFYHILLGMSYEVFTGQDFLGNRFDDWMFSSYYLGLRFNLLNEYTATQQFVEMFEYDDPPHIPGLNIYLKGHVGLYILDRTTFEGSLTGPGDGIDTYFNQTQSFGYFLGAGLEYRLFTMGFFLETGFTYIQHPRIARPLVTANHFRSFPVFAGINVYFGG